MSWRFLHKQTKNGFTVVEMMVVVAIGGIITTLAVPAYCKYASSAKQAQAKNALAAIWTAEQSFAIGNHSYTACLYDIGVSPTIAAPVQYYGFGFNYGQVSSSTGCGPGGNQTCFAQSWPTSSAPTPCASPTTTDGEASFKAQVNLDNAQNHTIPGGPQLNAPAIPPTGWVTTSTFFAMAVGNISSCNSAYDKWSIDQTKTLTNVVPSL